MVPSGGRVSVNTSTTIVLVVFYTAVNSCSYLLFYRFGGCPWANKDSYRPIALEKLLVYGSRDSMGILNAAHARSIMIAIY